MKGEILRKLEWLTESHEGSVASLYDQVAGDYDGFRALWLQLAGRQTEDAMLTDLAAVLTPRSRVLDAGAGTGQLSKRVLEMQPDASVVLIDASQR